MLIFNKYCFCSSIIDNYILLYNSQNDSNILLEKSTYLDLLYALESKSDVKNDSFLKLLQLGFLIDNKKNNFDIEIFKKKINTFRKAINSYSTYYLTAEVLNNNQLWEISDAELVECVNAIKNNIQANKITDSLIILKALNEKKVNHYYEIIDSILLDIKNVYKIKLCLSNNCESIYDRHAQSSCGMYDKNDTPCENISVLDSNDNYNIDNMIVSDTSTHSFLANKSMQMYANVIEDNKLFSQRISLIEMLCPYLSDNNFIIDYGILVKKCSKSNDPNAIVGFIDDGKIKLNKNYNKYILGIYRLHNECKMCRYVYVCMGQNCKHCSNHKIISCMPLGKVISNALTRFLINDLDMRKGIR